MAQHSYSSNLGIEQMHNMPGYSITSAYQPKPGANSILSEIQLQAASTSNKNMFSPSKATTVDPNTPEGQARAAAALKWGITPRSDPPAYAKPESSYTPEEQTKRAKLRAKGVNPASRAEMDAKVFGKGEAPGGTPAKKGTSFWSKIAQTSMGGGWIK